MIDAYEIGIQLALQDDVSAGLEVIARDLAEIDRAIAATNAGLAGLIRPSGAVAAMRSGVGAPARPQAPTESQVEPAAAAATPERSPPAAGKAMSATTPAAAPAAAPPITRGAGRDGVAEDRGVEEGAAEPVFSAAPTPAPVFEVEPAATAAPAAVKGVPAQAPVSIDPGGTSDEPVAPTRGVEGAAPVAEPVGSAPSLAPAGLTIRPLSVTSRVQARIEAATAPQGAVGAPVPVEPMTAMVAPTYHVSAERASAPAGGADERPYMPRAAATPERAVAPQAAEHSSGQGLSGNVMLDGRLVGYWLAEQMAREAARPPGGTSFFDPRQSPAWTASGAM